MLYTVSADDAGVVVANVIGADINKRANVVSKPKADIIECFHRRQANLNLIQFFNQVTNCTLTTMAPLDGSVIALSLFNKSYFSIITFLS